MAATKLSKSLITKLGFPPKSGDRHTQVEVYDSEVRGLSRFSISSQSAA